MPTNQHQALEQSNGLNRVHVLGCDARLIVPALNEDGFQVCSILVDRQPVYLGRVVPLDKRFWLPHRWWRKPLFGPRTLPE